MLGLVLPPLLCGLAGLIVGVIVFRVGSPEVYLPLVTLGIGVVAGLWFNDLTSLGASNGLAGIPPYTADIADPSTPATGGYVFNLIFVVLAFGGVGSSGARGRVARGGRWATTRCGSRRSATACARRQASASPPRPRSPGSPAPCTPRPRRSSSPSVAGVEFSAQALIWVAVGGLGHAARTRWSGRWS